MSSEVSEQPPAASGQREASGASRAADDGLAELRRIEDMTAADGSGRVEILDWERSTGGEKVKVEFLTPDLEREFEWMAWPRTIGSDSKFARLLESKGYELHEADRLRHETVSAHLNGDDRWEIRVDPESVIDRMRLAIGRRSPFQKLRIGVETLTALFLGTGLGASLVLMSIMSLLARARGDDRFLVLDDRTFASLFLFGMAARTVAIFAYVALYA